MEIMLDVVKVASYISRRYEREYGSQIDEMKLHKLLYFTQRESLIQLDRPLFAESFLTLSMRHPFLFSQSSVSMR